MAGSCQWCIGCFRNAFYKHCERGQRGKIILHLENSIGKKLILLALVLDQTWCCETLSSVSAEAGGKWRDDIGSVPSTASRIPAEALSVAFLKSD